MGGCGTCTAKLLVSRLGGRPPPPHVPQYISSVSCLFICLCLCVCVYRSTLLSALAAETRADTDTQTRGRAILHPFLSPLRRRQGGRKKFRCEVSGCGMTFAHRHTLVKHVKREHKTHRSAAAPPGVEASGECDGVGRKDSRTPDESHTTTPASDERGTPPE